MTDEKQNNEQYAEASNQNNQFVLVCGHCAFHDNRNCALEVNFADKAMYYKCSKCKKMNILDFSKLHPEPYPKIRAVRV